MSKRSVFQTDLGNDADGQSWRAFSALELYVKEAQGTITDKVVLYRAPGGSIIDITGSTDAGIENADDQRKLRLRKSHGTSSPEPAQQDITFDITVASFATDQAEFAGTLTVESDAPVAPPTTRPWRGFFHTYRETSLAVIQSGQKPLPPDVGAFLAVSPLSASGDNEVQSGADLLFLDLMIHGLPQRPIGLLFHGDVGEVGSRFAVEKMHGGALPSALQTAAGSYLNPKQILADNQRLFYFAGIHILVKSLRSSDDWFDKEFRDGCQDKVAPFFNMLACAEGDGSGALDNLKNTYGAGLTAAQELGTLRPQYRDAVKRCYDAAYACLRPSLADALSKPDFLGDVLAVLNSPQYTEHWLPTLIPLPGTPGSIPVAGQLAMLFDKLEFLAVTEAKSKGQPTDLQPVKEVISRLLTAAQQTGLVRNSIVSPTPEHIELKLDNVITEENVRVQSMINAMNYIESGGQSMETYPGQVESMVVHWWLKDEVKPLGLYTWELRPFSDCVVM